MAEIKKTAEVNRTIRPYVELFDISSWCLNLAKEKEYGRTHNCLISMAFCAFSIEAFLNHLGSELIYDWEITERNINHTEKIRKIFKELNKEYDKKEKPYCYIEYIFNYRKEIVHAKTRSIVGKMEIKQNGIPEMPRVQWEKMTNLERAIKFHRQTEEIITALNILAGNSNHPLVSPEDASWVSY
jgi:hypothetical protein